MNWVPPKKNDFEKFISMVTPYINKKLPCTNKEVSNNNGIIN